MQTNNKLREALEAARLFVTNCNTPLTTPLEGCGMSRAEVMNIIDTALAEPVKNCEVGTAEEQCRRFRKYCGCRCLTKCKVYEKGIALGIVNYNNYYKTGCHFIWAQMPYEEGGAK